MRKVIILGIAVLAAVAMLTAVAVACGEKGTNTSKASADGKFCPAASASVADLSQTAASGDSESMWETRTIAIKGMTCAACEKSVSASLVKTTGVVEVVKVCHMSQEAVVKVDPSKSQDILLAKAVTDNGYQAEVIPAVAKSEKASGSAPVCPLPCKMGASSTCCPTGSMTAKQAGAEKTPQETK